MIYQVQCSGEAFEIAFPRHILLIHPSLTVFVSSITVSTMILHNASLRSISLLLTSSEGTTEYTTCSGLLDESSSTWPESALFQIAANGVSLNKLVIGKPANAGDASNGYIAPATLAGCLEQAKAKGWSAGAMVWEVRGLYHLNI